MEYNGYYFSIKDVCSSFFQNIHKLLLANLLCLLCSLPVITMGAAIHAQNSVCKRCLVEHRTDVFFDFFHTFKVDFRKCTICWSIYLPAFILNIGLLFIYYQMRNNPVYFVSFIISCISLYFVLSSFVFLNMMIDVPDFSIATILKNSMVLVILECKKSILVFISIILLSFLVFLLFPFSALFILFFYFSVCSFLSNVFLLPMMQKRKMIIEHYNF